MKEENNLLMHLPQQRENLLQARATGDVAAVEHIFNGIKDYIFKGETKFVEAVDREEKENEKAVNDMLKIFRGNMEKALETKKDDEMAVNVRMALNALDAEYELFGKKYMEDMVTSVISYTDELNKEPEEAQEDG